MLGIIIGIASVILIISLGQGATVSITNQISLFGANLISVSPGGERGMGPGREHGPGQGSMVKTLTHEDSKAIAESKIPNVAAVSASVSKTAQVVANGQTVNVSVSGVESAYETIQSLEIDSGTFIGEDDVKGFSRVAVLGPQVVKDLFGEGADVIGKTIKVDSKWFRIIGVLKAKGGSGFFNPDDLIYVPITTEMKILLGQDYVQSIGVSASNSGAVNEVIDSVKQLLLERHNIKDPALADFSVVSAQQMISTLDTVTGILTALLTAVAAISLVVGGIGIMNIMLVTVTERTKEIGLLKAIGAKRRDILVQFLTESVVLTLSGGLIGILLGAALDYVFASVIGIPFVIQYTAVLIAVGVSSMVGIVFGLYPAQRAARLNPIEALRYE